MGLSLAWDQGFGKIWLELDSVEALNLIKHRRSTNHSNARMVNAITNLLARQWEIQLSHTHIDNNSVADKLASVDIREGPRIHVLLSPNSSCLPLYLEDLKYFNDQKL